jgi:hypothetical protein
MSSRAGDWVEVRSEKEILATLDGQGELDALPFMPEMLRYCGKRFRLYKSAHKTCDTIQRYTGRRMTDAVHLEGLRCDGMAHGGCQAGCLLFWKDAWLKPVPDQHAEAQAVRIAHTPSQSTRDVLARATVAPGVENGNEAMYRCQATELLRATTPLAWWDPRQYTRDIVSGNVRLRDLVLYLLIAAFNSVMRLHWRGRQYPYIQGLAGKTTPAETLNLQPDELVQVRTKTEIMRTLNVHQRNRGLWFDMEMVPYCGKTFRVLRRVEQIINEKTGKMMRLPGACLILEGVTCSGCLSTNRLFCPRSIYPYWHEIWLRRVENGNTNPGASS